jgi:RNA polymerase sigma-70 factor (ECF subfamily)
MDLKTIIAGCKKGQNSSFDKLIELYADRCFGYFYRLTGNRDISEELLSELFLKLVKKIKSCNESSFENWLFTVASNIFRDYLGDKYKRKKINDSLSEQIENYETTQPSQDPIIADQLQSSLNELDIDTREIIVMKFDSDMTFEQIAKQRKEPIGTTLSKYHRGIKKLRRRMENKNG